MPVSIRHTHSFKSLEKRLFTNLVYILLGYRACTGLVRPQINEKVAQMLKLQKHIIPIPQPFARALKQDPAPAAARQAICASWFCCASVRNPE